MTAKVKFDESENITFSQRFVRENKWLSPKEQFICEYLKENSQDVIHMSITELADCCSASEAAIVRVAKKLGYKGYQAMKIYIAQESIKSTSQIYEELSPDDTIHTIVKKVFHSNIQAIEDTQKVLDSNSMAQAVELIFESEQLLFYGLGGSSIIAQDAQHKFLRIGYLSYVFSDSNIQLMSTMLVKKGGVVILISHSGSSSAILEIASHLKKNGAKIITITSYSRCPLLKYADVSLFTSSPETAFKPEAVSSRIAGLTIIDSLFIGVSLKDYDTALANMQATRNVQASKKV
jgi:RpiR family transcriptional regulator, carbohydrate utilization regulator